MKILMIILLCLCLLLQIGCMGNPDTKESHQSGAETTLTEKNMTDTAEGPHGSAVLNHGDVIHKTLLSLSQCGSKYLFLSDELVRRGAADGTDEVIA